jgi:hypothetical protein
MVNSLAFAAARVPLNSVARWNNRRANIHSAQRRVFDICLFVAFAMYLPRRWGLAALVINSVVGSTIFASPDRGRSGPL